MPLNLSRDVLESLNSPSCRLGSLSFWCEFGSQETLIRAINEWIGLLMNNSTLKRWHIEFQFQENYRTEFVWGEFSSILCNRDSDSIEETYNSNHILSRLDFNFYSYSGEDDEPIVYSAEDVMPLERYSLLHLNRNPDKAVIARRKVINVHFSGASSAMKLVDLNLEFSVLSQLLSWIGKEKEMHDLSLMFGFMVRMPALLKGATAAPTSPDKKRMKMTNKNQNLPVSIIH